MAVLDEAVSKPPEPVASDEQRLALDLRDLDPHALAELDGTALGLIVGELKAKTPGSAKHSSHSSYNKYATYSMGPIG